MTDDFVSLPKPTDPKPHQKLLEKYLAGECTLPERVAIERWILAHPKWATAMGDLVVDGQVNRELWTEAEDTAAMEERVLGRIGVSHLGLSEGLAVLRTDSLAENAAESQLEPQLLPSHKRVKNSRDNRQRLWLFSRLPLTAQYVIGAVVATFLCMVGYASVRDQQKTSFSTYVYATGNGERTTLKLSDGTSVTLNVASRLVIPPDYGPRNRSVTLTGEAYFDVAHATQSPFIVRTGEVQTTVLGTEFVVRSYQPADVQVAVRTGRVSVAGVVLDANDIAHVQHDTAITIKRHHAVDAAFAFTSGRLKFINTPLHIAASDLERWYDVDIVFSDSTVANLPLSAVLPTGSVSDLVDVLRLTFDVNVKHEGRNLTISRQ